MDTLLLTSPADRHSHAFGSRKTACPASIHLLVGKHNVGETEITHQQATCVKTKKIVSKMLTTCSPFQPVEHKKRQASNLRQNQKNGEQNAHYLLTNWIANLHVTRLDIWREDFP